MYSTLHLDSDIPNDIEPLITGIVQNARNLIYHIRTICTFYATAHKNKYKKISKGSRLLLADFLVKRLRGKVDTKTDQFYPINEHEPAELKEKTRWVFQRHLQDRLMYIKEKSERMLFLLLALVGKERIF